MIAYSFSRESACVVAFSTWQEIFQAVLAGMQVSYGNYSIQGVMVKGGKRVYIAQDRYQRNCYLYEDGKVAYQVAFVSEGKP